MRAPDWDAYVRARFPAYLLPNSALSSIDEAEARQFLEVVCDRTDGLELLRDVSCLASHAVEIQAFCYQIAELCRSLPSRIEPERRRWADGYHGRLDVVETLRAQAAGHPLFVTRVPRRTFALPENIVLRHVVERLLRMLLTAHEKDLLMQRSDADLPDAENVLRRCISSSALREVPVSAPSQADEACAQLSRAATHRAAAAWMGRFRELDDNDPQHLARLLADSARLPLASSTRFELAVTIRAVEELGRELHREDPTWREERAVLHADRHEVFRFVRGDGAVIRFCFNQAVLDPGVADRAAEHYLGNLGRLRPDLTILFEKGCALRTAVVLECKESSNRDVLREGLHQAMLYRHEFAKDLRGSLKSILVTSGSLAGAPQNTDGVAAVAWAKWPPPHVTASLVEYATKL